MPFLADDRLVIAYRIVNEAMQLRELYPLLLHAVTEADRHCVKILAGRIKGIIIDRNAVGSSYLVLPPIALTDGTALVVVGYELFLEGMTDFLGLLGQSVLLHERQHGDRTGGKLRVQVQDSPIVFLSVRTDILLLVCLAEEGKEVPVQTCGSLDDIGSV